MTTKTTFRAVALAICVASAQSLAFNYVEHVEIYRLARQRLAPKRLEALGEFEKAERLVLGVDANASFTIEDVPALAGDYTTDVANLVNRLFFSEVDADKAAVPCGPAIESKPQDEICPQVPGAAASTRTLTATEWETFIKQQRKWSETLRKEEVPDYLVGQLGLALLPLATKNLSHFSVKGCPGALTSGPIAAESYLRLDEADFTSRYEGLGVRNSVRTTVSYESAPAYYVNYHFGAMAFAALAIDEQSEDTKRQMMALALLFEQFAIHHLSDLVAPGHQQCVRAHANRNIFDALGRRCSHQKRNVGMEAVLPDLLCKSPEQLPAAVGAACQSGPKAVLRGDGQAFFSVKEKRAETLSGDLAAHIARISIEEVLDARLTEGDRSRLRKLLDAQKEERFCHLGALLRLKSIDKRKVVLWAEGWVIGFADPNGRIEDEAQVQIMNNLAKGAGQAFNLLPVYPCP